MLRSIFGDLLKAVAVVPVRALDVVRRLLERVDDLDSFCVAAGAGVVVRLLRDRVRVGTREEVGERVDLLVGVAEFDGHFRSLNRRHVGVSDVRGHFFLRHSAEVVAVHADAAVDLSVAEGARFDEPVGQEYDEAEQRENQHHYEERFEPLASVGENGVEKLLVKVLALVAGIVFVLVLFFVFVLVVIRVGNDLDRFLDGSSCRGSVRCVFGGISASHRAHVVNLDVFVAFVVKIAHHVIVVAVVAEKHERVLLFKVEPGVAVNGRLVDRLAVRVEKGRLALPRGL